LVKRQKEGSPRKEEASEKKGSEEIPLMYVEKGRDYRTKLEKREEGLVKFGKNMKCGKVKSGKIRTGSEVEKKVSSMWHDEGLSDLRRKMTM